MGIILKTQNSKERISELGKNSLDGACRKASVRFFCISRVPSKGPACCEERA